MAETIHHANIHHRLTSVEASLARDDNEFECIRDELTDIHRDIRSTRRLTIITVVICVLTVAYVGHIATKAIANAAATVAQMGKMKDE